MAIVEMELDPNAATYTDDEIVGKVNTATANITRASSVGAAARPIVAGEIGATELAAEEFTTTEQTKLTNVEANATADQTGTEIQTAVLGLSDADRKLIKTDPQTGEFTVLSIQRKSGGNLGAKYESVAV